MKLYPNHLYHIYNQGNNQQKIFLERDDYLDFLRKIKKFLSPYADVLAYCLMPNHFHFLLNITEISAQKIKLGGIEIDQVTNAFRLILSGYAQDFNEKYAQSGSLFRQKTKGKCLTDDNTDDYAFICFNYIHQNPLKAGLVQKLEDWEFSSFQDYAGLRNGQLCNQTLTREYIDINEQNFYEESYQVINEKFIEILY